MATFTRLRRCVSTAFLFRARRFHILSNPNSSSAESSLLRPFSGHGRPDLSSAIAFPAAGALSSFRSRSFFARSGEDSVVETCLDIVFGDSEEESILPVRAVISMLDEFHDFFGLPWWMVIGCSILALRLTLLPLLIFQLHKLKRISESLHKLPSPFPPPDSGNSFIGQISLVNQKRKEIGCPSFLWFLPYVTVQVPCFFLWMTSIRRMSLDQHAGFDCGGALWFYDLTEYPHGALGCIFPVVIAGFHYANIQISFQKSNASKATGLLDLLVKFYKIYLDLLTLPIFLTCYYVPQGSLVYWATNSSLTLMQQLLLKDSSVRAKLGLLDTNPGSVIDHASINVPAVATNANICVEDCSPKELIPISLQLLSEQQIERAIYILQLALTKDPEYTHALVLMGQALLLKGQLAEAIEHLELAVSKLMLIGYPTEEEDVDHLILASMWMGSAYCRQGKFEEGLIHFERIGNLKEPDDPGIKAHYFDGVLMLSSALHNVGRREDSVKYLRLAAAYNPAYNEYLEQCENDDDDPFAELASSRRQDY